MVVRLHHGRAVGAGKELPHAPEGHEEGRARRDGEDDRPGCARAEAQERRVDVGRE
jgi:hypothetical protein